MSQMVFFSMLDLEKKIFSPSDTVPVLIVLMEKWTAITHTDRTRSLNTNVVGALSSTDISVPVIKSD